MIEDGYTKKLSIKAWAEADRPREKLLEKGKAALSDAELVAILISSGNDEESAVELSRRILQAVNNDLNELGKLTVADLTKFRGIGEAKAISIIAALELGRRRKSSDTTQKVRISASAQAYEELYPMVADLPHEEFWLLLLNRANQVLKKVNVSKGGVSQTTVDAKVVFKAAVDNVASYVILCHNHPSGNLKPSEADIKLTKNLVEAGKTLDIPVLDHIIIAEKKYFSFLDEGLM